jgi:hypothetical protein
LKVEEQAAETIFDVKSFDRSLVHWEDHLLHLTPVENIGDIWWKREDEFAPLGRGNINGSKLRQLIWLFSQSRLPGVISGAVTGSPQLPMTAACAKHWGMPCVQFTGGSGEMVTIAEGLGAETRLINPGYATTLNVKARNEAVSKGWLIFKRFPDLAKLDMDDLDRWFNKEFKRLAFDTDRRHQKSDFVKSVKCYQNLTHGDQENFFNGFINTEDQHENFRRAWDVVRNQFYSFGRLASFSYLEYLRIMRVNLDCDQLFLEDMSGSKSHRNGLAKVLGRDDLDWHDSNPTEFEGRYTPEMMTWLKDEAALLLAEARDRVAGKSYA